MNNYGIRTAASRLFPVPVKKRPRILVELPVGRQFSAAVGYRLVRSPVTCALRRYSMSSPFKAPALTRSLFVTVVICVRVGHITRRDMAVHIYVSWTVGT